MFVVVVVVVFSPPNPHAVTLGRYREFAFKQRRVIEAMSADRDRYDQEAQDAQQRYYAALENVKLAELQIAEVQKQIVDQETKLKSQQNTYESVRTDRNLKSKNLIESQDKVCTYFFK